MYNELQPKEVFYWFKKISEIPRCSGDEKRASDFLVEFAKERSLDYIQDEELNVIIKKPATSGYEDSDTVIIQGHMDMVCEKSSDSVHDFTCDPIELIVDGDVVRANNTTLGADNGIAVAFGLAILDSSDIPHPALELLVTTNEETGMDGAAVVRGENLDGKIMLNIDSDVEGTFLVSCAGGVNQTATFDLRRRSCNSAGIKIIVEGLKGGHSGVEIIQQRGNAIKIIARLLNGLRDEMSATISSITGGSKHNAIANYAEAVATTDNYKSASDYLNSLAESIKEEFAVEEPNLSIKLSEINVNSCLESEISDSIIDFLMMTPDGVQSMSKNIENLVETSLNTGIVSEEDDVLSVVFALRSSSASSLANLESILEIIAERVGANLVSSNGYPAWEYEPNSKAREVAGRVYNEVFGKEANIGAIHAGLECGILKKALPGTDMISFGPNIYGAHTTVESLSIESVQRVWKFVLKLLEELK